MSGSVHPTHTLFVNQSLSHDLDRVFSFFRLFLFIFSSLFPFLSFHSIKTQQWTEHGLFPAVMLEKLFLRRHPPLLTFASFSMAGTSPQHNSILNHDTTLDFSYIYTLPLFRLYLLPTFIIYTGEKILHS